ncbi:hypothetical protein [Xenorhabdus sp. SGI246]|uniref:DUF6911 family protein n=1 Tax=Xenorhabdus sp. SGI246 TaxID=3158263 RepID=UPI00349F7AE5
MSWTLNGKGGMDNSPDWAFVEHTLIALKGRSGTLTLDVSDNVGDPEMLQLRTEAGYYLIMLGEIFEDEYNVRSYYDRKVVDQQIDILGDYWSTRQLIRDFDLVVRIFKEFFDTGNVTKSLLN